MLLNGFVQATTADCPSHILFQDFIQMTWHKIPDKRHICNGRSV